MKSTVTQGVLSGLVLLPLLSSDKLLAADLEAGKLAYNQCIGCHSFAYHRTGPKHCNLIGRIAGTAEGFEYSSAMRLSGIQWDGESLYKFLASPFDFVPGTSMGFVGIKDGETRRSLIKYIVHQSESKQCSQ